MKRVCVYCGSRDGDDPAFAAAAETVGAGIAKRGMGLVYGAGDVGLMGRVATAAMDAGGDVLGVIPQHLFAREVGKRDLSELIVVHTMHERKMIMFDRSDIFVALPGGPGTLDELIEVLTWRQLGLHARPVMLVNTNGYWDPLIGLIDHVIAHGFASDTFRDLMTVVPDAGTAVAEIEARLAG